MRAFIFRHGETDHNRDGMTQGREDNPLNDLGRQQAQAIGKAWGRHRFGGIYASPLSRATDTAAPLAAAVGLPVVVRDELIEMDVGELGSLTSRQLREQHGPFLELWRGPTVADARMPGGETLREVQERAWRALEELANEEPEVDVAVFTHNFVTLSLICRALNLDLANFRRVRHGLAALSIIDFTGDGPRLESMNDRSHLEGLEGPSGWGRQ